MATVQAWQHIYVPHKKGGYHTLFYTRSALTEDEIEEMEARLFHKPSESVPVKRGFFTTSTGKAVLTQIVPLAGADIQGRTTGRYLAHSLVFTPELLEKLEADLFWIFRHASFIHTVEQALECGDFQTGDIPSMTIEVPPVAARISDVARHWSTQELKDLILLALRADQLARERQTVVFVGEPSQIEVALETAFFAVPTPLRPNCTFDTYFYLKERALGFIYYWAIGESSAPDSSRYIIVDAKAYQVVTKSDMQGPETIYERWVSQALDRGDLDTIALHKDYAYALCRWLDDYPRDISLADTIPAEVIVSVFQENAQQVQELLRNMLERQFPPVLVSRVFDPICRGTAAVDLFRQMRQGFEVPQLLQVLYQVYEGLGFRSPQRKELQALGSLLQHTEHRALCLLHACWTNQPQQLRQILATLNEDEYQQFVQTALQCGIGEPLNFLVQGRGDTFLTLYLASDRFREQDMGTVVQAYLDAEEISCLARLVPHIAGRSGRELRRLEKIVHRQASLPESFKHAVQEAMATLPPPIGLKGLLSSLLSLRRQSRDENSEEI